MTKDVPLFLSTTGEGQTLLLPNKARKQEFSELREKTMEEAQKPALNMLEHEIPISPTDKFWTNRTRERLRAMHTKKEEPQNAPRKSSEPKVNSATAALRKQYIDIQSKIYPAKPATPKIRWTPNLPIPPPDGPDPLYAPSEIRTPESFLSTPPKVSVSELRKRKREKEEQEREEMEADEALDTEVVPKLKPPKLRRGEKRLNELEEAMKVAGMYPEDPDRKTEEKGKGRGRGKGCGGKSERPWEETGTRGWKRGRGQGRGRGGRFVSD